MLDNNLVPVAWYFRYKVKVLSKETILDGPVLKTKYYARTIEVQEGGSPHVLSITWIFSAQNIQNEAAYIEFIKKTKLSCQIN